MSMRATGALAVLALALPASAAAVPSVTSVVAKTGDPGVTFLTDPTGAGLIGTQTRYVVALDGYALGLVDDNGVAAGGVLDYSALPADYRAPMTPEQKLVYPAAQTGLQAHATCSDVASLERDDTILAWQGGSRGDPAYRYVPWQTTSAGLGDDPATWLSVVRSATGVDLTTVTDRAAACTRLGGTYHAADGSTNIAGAQVAAAAAAAAATQVAAATAPLRTQIAGLQRDNATLARAKDVSDRAAAAARVALAVAREAQRAAEVAYQSIFTRPIELTLAAKRFAPDAGVALITGSATDPVTVTVEVTRRQRRALRLPSRVIAEVQREIGPEGAVLVRLAPDRATVRRLRQVLSAQRGRTIGVSVRAVSGGNSDAARATLTR
ncbi:hypothetical protein [Conexibacter sp. CPCC 206217]|uniref:hypothetical protein n=1 Tax=Conexibacter sp. CPCC 206217 TaxID=3064574 RepID=UPI002721F4D8|nr:hypothetical protein [Conexibacter sp. CPCC 206217]MDO8211067.1 hypothetical protein [Conexibacter sp. CPCC 206217]